MKITKRQLRRIIKEQKARLLRETIADGTEFESLINSALTDMNSSLIEIANMYESLMGEELYDEDPEMFQGRSTREEWIQQVGIASDELVESLEQAIKDAINRTIAENEGRLHDGQFHMANGGPGWEV